MTITIQTGPFDISAEIAKLTAADTSIGAVASFVGKVRADQPGGTLKSMTLEHYPGMTEMELARIEADAVARFQLKASCIIHRVGPLVPGDDIVLVIACAPHRAAALAACDFMMDYLKTDAPFWKKETSHAGIDQWVDTREADQTARRRWTADNK